MIPRPLRTVVASTLVEAMRRDDLPWWRLELSCGHTELRKAQPQRDPPRAVVCVDCCRQARRQALFPHLTRGNE